MAPRFANALALPLLILAAGPALGQGEDWQQRKDEAGRYFEDAFSGRAARPTADPTPSGAPAAASELRPVLAALFDAYEKEDVAGFMEHVDEGFQGADRSGNDYVAADLPRALADDFQILDRIHFEVQVGAPTIQRDGSRAQVEVRWSRRAIVQTGGQELLLVNQQSTLQFLGRGGRWRLVRIFGAALFGLADRAARIVVRQGSIDGRPIAAAVSIDRYRGIVEEDPGTGPGPAVPDTVEIVEGTFNGSGMDLDLDAGNQQPGCTAPAGGTDLQFGCGGSTFSTLTAVGGAGVQEIARGNVGDVKSVPVTGYGAGPINLSGGGDVGRLFAVRTGEGKFAVFGVEDFSGSTWGLRYRYRTDGGNTFP